MRYFVDGVLIVVVKKTFRLRNVFCFNIYAAILFPEHQYDKRYKFTDMQSHLDRCISVYYFYDKNKIIVILSLKTVKGARMKFLVGYDGTSLDERVLKLAQKYASAFNADIYIVTSLEQSSALEKAEIDKAEGELEYLRTPFNIDDINCETFVSVNYLSPGEDLVQFAKDNEIDMMFIGIKKTSKVGKLVFGSTAQYVLLNAPCPVVASR